MSGQPEPQPPRPQPASLARRRPPPLRSRRSSRGRWAAVAVAVAVIAVVVVLRLPGGEGGPRVVTTPNGNTGINGAPGFETMLSIGDGTLIGGYGNAFWCSTSACADGPSLAAWTTGPFASVAGGVLADGKPVLAGLTEVQGDILRLALLGCTRRACTAVGGGVFSAPGFDPAGGANGVDAASANGAGFAVVFDNLDANGAETLYVVACDTLACQHPRATRLGQASGIAITEPGVSDLAVAAAPHGGFAVALADVRNRGIDVYECAATPCRAMVRQQVPALSGALAITVSPSGQALLAYDSTGTGTGSQVVLAGAPPGGSFSQLAAVNAPVSDVNPGNFPDSKPAPDPAITFGGRDLLVVSEDPPGHAVTLTTCTVTACANTVKVSRVADVGNPIADLGIGVPAGTQRIFWATQDTDILGGISYSGHLWIGGGTYP